MLRHWQQDEAAHQFDRSFLPMARLGADQKITQIARDLASCDIRTNATFTEALLEIAKAVPSERNAICHKLAAALDADPLSVSLMGGPLRAEYRESFRKLLDM